MDNTKPTRAHSSREYIIRVDTINQARSFALLLHKRDDSYFIRVGLDCRFETIFLKQNLFYQKPVILLFS